MLAKHPSIRSTKKSTVEGVRAGVCAALLLESLFLPACTAGHSHLTNVSSRLLSFIQTVEGASVHDNRGLQQMRPVQEVRVDEAGRLEVMIDATEVTADILNELRARGCSIEIYDPAQHLIQAWVPMQRLREVAGLPFVKFLDLPNYGVTNRPKE